MIPPIVLYAEWTAMQRRRSQVPYAPPMPAAPPVAAPTWTPAPVVIPKATIHGHCAWHPDTWAVAKIKVDGPILVPVCEHCARKFA